MVCLHMGGSCRRIKTDVALGGSVTLFALLIFLYINISSFELNINPATDLQQISQKYDIDMKALLQQGANNNPKFKQKSKKF